jgi:hypothetical protein
VRAASCRKERRRNESPTVSTPFLILRSDPTNGAELDEIGLHIEGLVMVFKSPFVSVGSKVRSDTVTEHHWEEKRPRAGATMVVVDDLELPARYCCARSPDGKHEHAVWKNLRFLLRVVPPEELKDDARQPDADPGALPRLAVSLDASAFDEEAFQLIVRGLAGEEEEHRAAAAMAAMILKWKKLLPALREAIARAEGAGARRAMDYAVTVLETRGSDVG